MQHKFDELNINNTSGQKQRISSYKEYFEVMDLPEEELEDRVELAKKIQKIMVALFLLLLANAENITSAKYITQERLTIVLKDFFKIEVLNSYLQGYVQKVTEEVIKITIENYEDDYYTSVNRARFIAANEANLIGNYSEQLEAIKNGYTTKMWVTERDMKVRHTHTEVDGLKIDIAQPFIVGGSKMMFPKDFSLGAGAGETVNCRCKLIYTKF